MIVWTPVAVNEKPVIRGKTILPIYSAAAIGTSVVLRLFGGGFGGLSFALTTIPFATREEADAWIEANKSDETYDFQIRD